jgi:hypothetical protein
MKHFHVLSRVRTAQVYTNPSGKAICAHRFYPSGAQTSWFFVDVPLGENSHRTAHPLINPISTSRLLPVIFRKALCLALSGGVFAITAASHAQSSTNVSPDQGSLQSAIGRVPEGGVIELRAGTYDAPAGGSTIFPDLNAGGTGVGVVDVYVF